MKVCEQCKLQWNTPPEECPKCHPSVCTPAKNPIEQMPKKSFFDSMNDKKIVERRTTVVNRLGAWGHALMVLGVVGGICGIILGIILLVIPDVQAQYGMIWLSLGVSTLLNGFVLRALFDGFEHLIVTNGRTEQLQMQILKELQKTE